MAEALLPGLPDDVAREVLCRLPFASFPAVRSVSPLWKQQISSVDFHRLRRSSGHARTVVALSQASPEPPAIMSGHPRPSPYRIALFDTLTGLWSSLPPSPDLPHGLPLFCGLAAAGTDLAVVGGWDPSTWASTDRVHLYDFASGGWRRGTPMPGPLRSSFACVSDEERRQVFVAGGHDESQNALRSALAYDVAGDAWARLPDMAGERDECVGAYARGELTVAGGGSWEAMEVTEGRWRAGGGEVGEGWKVAGDGERVYRCGGGAVAVAEGRRLWRRVAEVPEDLKVVVQVVAWKGRVVVMGLGREGGCGLVVYELDIAREARKAAGTEMVWRRVEVPPEFQGRVQAACCIDI